MPDSSSILFDGYPCLDAVQEAENLANLSLPVPDEFAHANSFFNVVGEHPGHGWFLVTRETVNAINLNGVHSVQWSCNLGDLVDTYPMYNLVIVSEPRNLTPGIPNDPNACYLVEVADQRYLLSDRFLGIGLSQQYNIRAPGFGNNATTALNYYESSLALGTTTWTWQTMVTDLWTEMSGILGSNSTLPFSPDGRPEGWNFQGVNAWTALTRILERLSCAVVFDPRVTSNQYSIVRLGSGDNDTTTFLAKPAVQNRLIYDAEFRPIVRAQVPGTIRVFFHNLITDYGAERTTPRLEDDQWLSNNATYNEVTNSTPGADASLIHEIWDDLPALRDCHYTLQNSAALTARAAERAADFIRCVNTGGRRMQQVYSGLLTIKPTGTVRGVSHRQDLDGIGDKEYVGGFVTEIVNFPYMSLRVDPDVRFNNCCGDSNISVSNKRSEFGPQFPIYPHLMQVVYVTSNIPDADDRYPAVVQMLDPATLLYSDEEDCLAVGVGGAALEEGYYIGRLSGSPDGVPLYQVGVIGFTNHITIGIISLSDQWIGAGKKFADGWYVGTPTVGGNPNTAVSYSGMTNNSGSSETGDVGFSFVLTSPTAGAATATVKVVSTPTSFKWVNLFGGVSTDVDTSLCPVAARTVVASPGCTHSVSALSFGGTNTRVPIEAPNDQTVTGGGAGVGVWNPSAVGQTVYWMVTQYSPFGEGGPSESPPNPALANAVVSLVTSTFTIEWTPVPIESAAGGGGYRIYRYEPTDPSGQRLIATITDPSVSSYVDTGSRSFPAQTAPMGNGAQSGQGATRSVNIGIDKLVPVNGMSLVFVGGGLVNIDGEYSPPITELTNGNGTTINTTPSPGESTPSSTAPAIDIVPPIRAGAKVAANNTF